MVDFQKWTQIAFEVAEEKGFEPASPTQGRLSSGGRGFAPGNSNAQLMQVLSDVWQDRKREIRQASTEEAEEIADAEIRVA